MKYQLHVPVEQYGFIAAEVEGTAEEAVKEYKAVQKAWFLEGEMPAREWCQLRDSFYATGKMGGDPGILGKLSMAQQYWVNETKNAIKGGKRKEIPADTWGDSGPGKGENGDYSGMD